MAFNHESISRIIGDTIWTKRKEQNKKQLECATAVGISERTWRAYEKGESKRLDFGLLKIIYQFLGIDPEQLNLLTLQRYTPEQARELLAQVGADCEGGAFSRAFHTASSLVSNLREQIGDSTEDPLLNELAQALFLMGHTHSITRQNRDMFSLLTYFQEMAEVALRARNYEQLSIARSYEGEMLRRMGRFAEAIAMLKTAPQEPTISAAVRGNRSQFLARAYGSQGDRRNFESEMKRAEELAYQVRPQATGIYLPYNLGSVYEKYAQFYAQQGSVQRSLKYIDEAEKHIPATPRWRMKLKMTRGEVLIRSVILTDHRDPHDIFHTYEFKYGLELITEAAEQAHKHNHQRLLRQASKLYDSFSKQGTKLHMVSHEIQGVLKDVGGASDKA